MKITLLPVHAFELRIVSTAVWMNASAFCLSAVSLASSTVDPYGQGVSGCPSTATYTPPCMSLHWSGLIQTKSGAWDEFRSAARSVYGLMLARRAGLLRTSSISTNGLCLFV